MGRTLLLEQKEQEFHQQRTAAAERTAELHVSKPSRPGMRGLFGGTMPPMPDQRPALDYAEPAVKTRRRIPWWLDIPLVILTALGIVLAFIMLAVFFSLG